MQGKGQRWKGEGGAARLPARRARALAAAGGSRSASPPRTQDKIPSDGTVYVYGQSKPNVREMAEMRTQPLPKLNPLCEPYVRTPFSSSNQGSRLEGAATATGLAPARCQTVQQQVLPAFAPCDGEASDGRCSGHARPPWMHCTTVYTYPREITPRRSRTDRDEAW